MKIRNTVSGTKIAPLGKLFLQVPVSTRWLSIDWRGFVCAHSEEERPQGEILLDSKIWYQYETGTGSRVYGTEVAVLEPYTFEVSDDDNVHLFKVDY